MTNSTAVRAELVEALQLDLVGPTNDHPFAWEVLKETPQHWYLTGFLVPEDVPLEERADPDADDEEISGADAVAVHEGQSDRMPAQPSLLPASIGLTFLVPPRTEGVQVSVEWGDYTWIGAKAPLPGLLLQQNFNPLQAAPHLKSGVALPLPVQAVNVA